MNLIKYLSVCMIFNLTSCALVTTEYLYMEHPLGIRPDAPCGNARTRLKIPFRDLVISLSARSGSRGTWIQYSVYVPEGFEVQLERPVVAIKWESVNAPTLMPLELIGEKDLLVGSLLKGETNYGRKLGRFEDEADFHRRYAFHSLDGEVKPLSDRGMISLPTLIINGVKYVLEEVPFQTKKSTNIVAINGC